MEDLTPEELLAHGSTGMYESSSNNIQCCCGREECPYLAHNSTVLEGVEKDLLSAARIGQALLARHESHMAEAEEERRRMSGTIDELEEERKELEMSNARVIAENRDLLNQLEQLNTQVLDSDVEIQSLTSTLAATRLELQRLTSLANRAEQLERQLTEIETDHADLLSKQTMTEDETKSAMQRWKRAEGTIIYLQDQIDRIEREAREERERHVEVLGRLERRRAVERELDKAAGRLKGAALNKNLTQPAGTNIVSHFVRDILQDNANLQNGVVELREMLMESNSEVENLREQLVLHQPVESKTSTLKAELGVLEVPSTDNTAETPFKAAPEVHVHHHYHAPEVTIKRPKKKRTPVTSGHFTPTGSSLYRHRRSKDWRISTSSANTILSQTSVTVPQNRWSMQSGQTGFSYAPSSIPSSPRMDSSVFDPTDAAFDSIPSTPGSSVLGSSPPMTTKVDKRLNPLFQGFAGSRSVSTPNSLQLLRKPATTRMSSIDDFDVLSPLSLQSPHSTIQEEPDLTSDDATPSDFSVSFTRPMHRRAASHESLFSLAESQRPLKSQLSQTFGVTARGFSPITNVSATSQLTSEPTIVHATVSATPRATNTPRQRPGLDLDLATSVLSQVSTPVATPTGKKSSTGGWAWSKWGKAPTPTIPIPKSPQVSQNPFDALVRSPGVNQSGWIRGLKPPRPTPSSIEPEQIDQEALIEALGD